MVRGTRTFSDWQTGFWQSRQTDRVTEAILKDQSVLFQNENFVYKWSTLTKTDNQSDFYNLWRK